MEFNRIHCKGADPLSKYQMDSLVSSALAKIFMRACNQRLNGYVPLALLH